MKKSLLVLGLAAVFLTSCGDKKKEEVKKEVETKVEAVKEEVKEVVTDPITMDRCDKIKSISYDNNFFCSEESLEKYKKEKK